MSAAAVAVDHLAVARALEFTLPPELEAAEPPEARGLTRDAVRLLVASRDTGSIRHRAFAELPGLLRSGDAVVINTSATLPAAVDLPEGFSVHFSTELPGSTWLVELRRRGERFTADPPSRLVRLPGGAQLLLRGRAAGDRLWRAELRTSRGARTDVVRYLRGHGRPIRYGYVDRGWPLESYQTVFARDPGSAEMPSAGRPFTAAVITDLVARGVVVLPVTLHTGVASPEADEPPYAERFDVPRSTARQLNAVRAGGGRVVAVGTTVVRALESAVDPIGRLRAASGWTETVITPERGVRAVDGLLTGFHEPRASHLLMLEAIAGRTLVEASYRAALDAGYLWHEFGDVNLYL
ncbi:MAG: S-adenosylmethionine:tRNA ribosyltransferase-isomerase [Actinomycetota bacterium]|nr:S-adenosylmethionine:tRNA ribosyltransferase-isomerase [Actinomycetota bacterium]